MKKIPIYRREKVPHVWLVDPRELTVEVFALANDNYTLVGTFGGDDAVVAPPFDAVPIPPHSCGARSRANAQTLPGPLGDL